MQQIYSFALCVKKALLLFISNGKLKSYNSLRLLNLADFITANKRNIWFSQQTLFPALPCKFLKHLPVTDVKPALHNPLRESPFIHTFSIIKNAIKPDSCDIIIDIPNNRLWFDPLTPLWPPLSSFYWYKDLI